MSSGLSRRLQLGIVFGLCATGMASAQRRPSAGASAGFPAAGSAIKDCAECPELLVVPAGQFLITESLDTEYGLDKQAEPALSQWRFEPGRKDGKSVPVLITVEMRFTAKK